MKQLLFKFTLFTFLIMTGVTYAQTVSTNNMSLDGSSFGSEILIPIYSQDITSSYGNIVIATIRVEYNEEVLDYVEYTNLNAALPSGELNISVNPSGGSGAVQLNIEHTPFTGFAWPDGKMFDLKFDYEGGDAEFEIVSGSTSFLPPDFIEEFPTITQGSVIGYADITATDGDWNSAGTWTGELGALTTPGLGHNVTINSGGTVTLSSGSQVNSVTVSDGGQLTQDATTTLDVTGDFTIESGGSFIQNGTVNAASKIAERQVEAYTANDDGWHLLSSPVASQAIDPVFTGNGGLYDFFNWHEPTQTWQAFGDGFGGPAFTPGIGYLVAYENVGMKQFSGDFNTADIENIPLTRSVNDSPGWNLLGNPYPSALEWGTGDWGLGNVQAAAYVWDEATKDYVIREEGDIIPAMNGFMVYLTSGTTSTMDIPANARVHDGQTWYKNEEEKVVLKAHDPSNQSAKEHVVKFNAGASADYEAQHDAVYISGYAPDLYSFGGSKALMVNTLPSSAYESPIPLSFVKNEGQEYVIELAENTTGQEIYLIDKKTGNTVYLSQDTFYEFTAAEGDEPERFELKFSTVGIDEQADNRPNVYVAEQTLVVENLKAKTEIAVYNTQGQLLYEFDAQENSRFEKRLHVKEGIYVIHTQSKYGISSKKVFIK